MLTNFEFVRVLLQADVGGGGRFRVPNESKNVLQRVPGIHIRVYSGSPPKAEKLRKLHSEKISVAKSRKRLDTEVAKIKKWIVER